MLYLFCCMTKSAYHCCQNIKGDTMSHERRKQKYILVPFLVSLFLASTVFLFSCSKKDVKTDETAITPTEGAGAAASDESADAGAASEASSDMSTAYFDFDSFQVNEQAKEALRQNAEWLKSHPGSKVRIEGHCDERGTTEYNLALGEKRANAAKRYLVSLGIKRGRISTISYGKERPADPGHSEEAWAKNRRAVLVHH